LSDTASRLAH